MTEQFPALLVTIPLIAAFFVTALGWIKAKLCYPLSLLAMAGSLFASLGLFIDVLDKGHISYQLGGWRPLFGIEYAIDPLNGFVLVLISLVSFLNLLSAHQQLDDQFSGKSHAFYALYLLFTVGLLGITVTGDAFNLYVLLEITALTGYALIGMGRQHAAISSLNYLIMGTIGASLYLLGVGYLYISTGMLNMAHLASVIPSIEPKQPIILAFVLCMVGLFIKMALFPLHIWLPNAYSYAPTAASGLIAPLTTKVMIYVMIRLVFSVFSPVYSFSFEIIPTLLVWLATIAIIVGSILALTQKNLLKMFSYVIIAEVGYMVGGFWLGNQAGMTGAILHIANDALMTLCLFLAAGSIMYVVKSDALLQIKGLINKMPFTMAALIVAALSIIGVPPTCGFFSKWYLIKGGLAAGHYEFVVALLFSSLVNVVLFFKIIEIGYYDDSTNSGHAGEADKSRLREAPLSMLTPLWITAVLLVVVGLYTNEIVLHVINRVLPKV